MHKIDNIVIVKMVKYKDIRSRLINKAMQKRKKLAVEFVGSDYDLNQLVHAFRAMEYFGQIGASRDVVLSVDGDGAGQIGVKFIDFKEEVEVSEKAKESADSGKPVRFGIGD